MKSFYDEAFTTTNIEKGLKSGTYILVVDN